MSLWDRVVGERHRAWPVGQGVVTVSDRMLGHDDDTYSPEKYGDYLVTSNEVFSAVSLRAKLASTPRLRLYRGDGPDKQEVTAGAARDVLRHVNPFWTWARLARVDEMSMGLWGESFWAVEKTRAGEPAEIWWLKPSRVTPIPDENRYLAGFWYEPSNGQQRIPFAADEVVWFRYPNPLDEFSALSPIAAARLAADTASAMMTSNRNLFAQGMQMGGLVVPSTDRVSFTTEQAEDLEKLLERRFKGVDKAHRWAVLRYEAQFNPMGVTPKDAEFVDGLNLTLRQVANAYGIPAPLLNDLEHATLANLREFQKALWEHALVPDLVFRAQEIEEQFLPMFRGVGRAGRADHAEYDFSTVAALQESQSEAWDRERQAIEIGALTVNEWRKNKGLPSVAWGDVWWAPVNKGAVDSADSALSETADPQANGDSADPEGDEPLRALLAALTAPRTRHLSRDADGRIIGVTETVTNGHR